jgi:glycosyltransferase involved in cell wall biosynthesis
MGKKYKPKPKTTSNYPFVSVCTPTFNRRPFMEMMFQCFRNQNYPKSKLEWIIIDDGTDKIEDLVNESNIPQIKYFKYDTKMTLGKKRNLMHEKSKGSYIVYMDDDDYYPHDRISHAIETLQKNPEALCAGSSAIHVYFKHLQKIVRFGPYGDSHATAATFAFRRQLLDSSNYDDEACLAEEKKFLKDYTVPFVQLDPKKSILVFSHEHNSFDKRALLENPNPKVVNETDLKVEEFVREQGLRDFFLNKVDNLLVDYEPGHPKNKPDVINQMNVIKERRAKSAQEEASKQGSIMVQQEGKMPKILTNQEILELLNSKDNQLKQLMQVVNIKDKELNELKEENSKKEEDHNKRKETLLLYEEKIELLTKINETYENKNTTIEKETNYEKSID